MAQVMPNLVVLEDIAKKLLTYVVHLVYIVQSVQVLEVVHTTLEMVAGVTRLPLETTALLMVD